MHGRAGLSPSASFHLVTISHPQPGLWSPFQGGLPIAEGMREESGFCSGELNIGEAEKKQDSSPTKLNRIQYPDNTAPNCVLFNTRLQNAAFLLTRSPDDVCAENWILV